MDSVKKRFSSIQSLKSNREEASPRDSGETTEEVYNGLSPELVPIVTLLSSQAHRRYYEGIIMLYYDLNGDGKPADREWREVYGIFTGNQLAYWDAAHLAAFRNSPEALLETSSKPNYINFTDSVYNAMKSLPAAKRNLDNVIIVSTTLKNRYIMQFKTYLDLQHWYLALRLASYEYQSLQEAYTGALLSARGSRLSDIRTILAEKRFDHEDWVSIRYGSGMAWKRCYAVIEPSILKKKSFKPGRILFYESEQKKKKQLMAVVVGASSVTATYPQSHLLIDHSTMLKVEASINFKSPSLSTKISKQAREDFKNTSIFLMPEQHSSVPGFDTLIRFMVPLLDSFGLYGRPKRLKADRIDPDSLLFGLPTLPHVHYLELGDLLPFTARGDFLSWDVKQWSSSLKDIMRGKLSQGYEGCGSSRGVVGAINSLNSPTLSDHKIPTPPPKDSRRQVPQQQKYQQPPAPSQLQHQSQPQPQPQHRKAPNQSQQPDPYQTRVAPNARNVNNLTINPNADKQALAIPTDMEGSRHQNPDGHRSTQLAEIYQKYATIKSPSDQFHNDRNQLLNGSAEDFDEGEMPDVIQKLTLNDADAMYPANDDNLFSDENDDETEDSEDESTPKQVATIPQINLNGSLALPQYQDRNSSYSSVKSPMTQYNEFNEQFKLNVVDRNTDSKHSAYPDTDNNSSSDSDIPVPPPHELKPSTNLTKSKPSYNLPQSINTVPHGATTPRATKGDRLSIHSEAGNVTSVNSSPYSNESGEDKKGYAPAHHQPHSEPQQTSQYPNQPRHDYSRNHPQNPQVQNQYSSQLALAPGPQAHTLAPSKGYKQPPVPAPVQAQLDPQVHKGRHAYGPKGQVNKVPQAPPQQQAYPQSLQFGYQPQPQSQPQPQPHPQPPQPQHQHQPHRHPHHASGKPRTMQPSNQYRGGHAGEAPMPQQQGYPRQQNHDGIPPSVSFNNSSHQQKPGPSYGQPYGNRIHVPQTGAPQPMGLQQVPFQQQRNYSNGYIPRHNNPPNQQQYPQNTAGVSANPASYQNQASSGIPPSAMNRGPYSNQNQEQYQGGQPRPY